MAKFSFKRPRIISKKFKGVDSTIDGVTKSLNDLVFSYTERVDKSLQKKHVMMAMSSLVLLIVLGSFISPKGKAESSIFYPDTCLGGWVNPQYAQGEQETTSNGDESQFTKNNSAVLPKNTDAEMYCGNFKGKFDSATKPTKIVVSLALTKGADLLLEDTLESGLISTSTLEKVGDASSTESTSFASSTASSTLLETSSTTVDQGGTSTATVDSSSTPITADATTSEQATGTPVVSPQEPPSIIDGIIESVKDTINTLFTTPKDTPVTTDTVVVPPPAPVETPAPTPTPTPAPVPEATPEPAPPTSLRPTLQENIFSALFQKVFAQEAGTTTDTTTDSGTTTPPEITPAPVPVPTPDVSPSSTPQTPPTEIISAPKEEVPPHEETPTPAPATLLEALTNNVEVATSTSATTTMATSTDMASSTELTATTTNEMTATTTEENQFQNNFLEVLYTFDGVTWMSLGSLNEISMKYRTFEIPVTASTSWSDMSRLQIKIVAKKHLDETPTVYLDAIKVEVLYETTLLHSHPDFARDTILKDETIDDMRIVTIINSETKLEEIWYMYLDIASTTEVVATSTDSTATTTSASSTPPEEIKIEKKLTEGTSTEDVATTTATSTEATSSTTTPLVIKPVHPKNIWMKWEGTKREGLSGQKLREAILTTEEEKNMSKEEKKRELPDFTLDVIRRIKGTFLNAVIVQLEKRGQEELWMYDLEKDTQEKISVGSSTSIAENSPLGVKGDYIFWVSSGGYQVFAYNITTKEIKEQPIPKYDVSKGERGEVTFEGIPWKVIISADGFFFWSVQTGEVFSDDNGSVAEALRQKLKLDTVMDMEDIGNLNLQVEEVKSGE